MNVLLLLILLSWLVAMVRLLLSCLASDVLIIKNLKQKSRKVNRYTPKVSVLIPAYNEEFTILRTLRTTLEIEYPKSKLEIIVVNDGSTDQTKKVITDFKKLHKNSFKIRLINRPNGGKARALNYAIKYCARGSIIFCLDADTTFQKSAVRNAVKYFKNKNTIALSCYADIIEDGSILALAQRIEYIIGFRIKSGHTLMDANYIIPGTGSAFRKSILKRVNYYESNTMTEDLDLTVKIMSSKKKNERIDYAPDVVAYTEAVHTVNELLTQRFRWTYGRAQVFVKHSNIFFSRAENHSKLLTWGTLPFTIVQDISFLLSPLINIALILLSISLGSPALLTGGIITLTLYLLMSIWSVDHLGAREKLRLSYYAPPMYFLILLTAIAEYYALVKAISSIKNVKRSLTNERVTWKSPVRTQA